MTSLVDSVPTRSASLPAPWGLPALRPFRAWAAADCATLAIVGIVVSSLLIAISDVCSKVLTKSLPAIEVAWLRYLVFSLLVLPLLARGGRDAFKTVRPRVQLTRGIASGLATGLAITGFAFLPVAEATAIGFVAPIFVTALAMFLLSETVGMRRWAAALVGLGGVMLIVQPGTASFRVASLLPLAAALASASSIIATRTMRTERARTTLLYTAFVGTAVLTPAALYQWVTPNWQELGLALLAGGFAALSNMTQIYCYRYAAASIIAPFTYTQLVWASLLGMAIFDYVPGLNVLVGAAVIAGSGIYTAYRERVRRSVSQSRAREAPFSPRAGRRDAPVPASKSAPAS